MARCYPVDTATLATGARVTLTLGGLVLAGTVRRGGTFVSSTGILVVGGADGWARTLGPRAPYRADNGVRLSTVAADLAADAGERVALEPGVERVLGYAWTRGAGVASGALDALSAGLWWVAPGGETRVGPRPAASAVPGATVYSVEACEPERGWARLSCPDDALGAFLPGVAVPLGEGAGTMAVEAVDVAVDPGRVVVELRGRLSGGAG
jgi:hypothetical protein